LPLELTKLANSKATILLLLPLILNAIYLINALKESLYAQKLFLPALSLRALKRRQLSNIFLTLTRKGLRFTCVR
jgi:hypothetical protein